MKNFLNPASKTILFDSELNSFKSDQGSQYEFEKVGSLDVAFIGIQYAIDAIGKGGIYLFTPEYSFEHISEYSIQMFKKTNKAVPGFEHYASGDYGEIQSLLIREGMLPNLLGVVYAYDKELIYRIELEGWSLSVFEDFMKENPNLHGLRISLPPQKGLFSVDEDGALRSGIYVDENILVFSCIKISEDVKKSATYRQCKAYLECR